mgnify:CR=1 FL=1
MIHDPCERIRAEADTSVQISQVRKPSRVKQDVRQNSPESAGDSKDEPDFVETNCHWKDCCSEFPTQEELVKVIWEFHSFGNSNEYLGSNDYRRFFDQ